MKEEWAHELCNMSSLNIVPYFKKKNFKYSSGAKCLAQTCITLDSRKRVL